MTFQCHTCNEKFKYLDDFITHRFKAAMGTLPDDYTEHRREVSNEQGGGRVDRSGNGEG